MSEGSRWMVLGSSPSAPEHCNTPEIDFTISSGDGIILRHPDYYFIMEESALWRRVDERYEAQRNGTKIVLSQYLVQLLRGKKYQDFLDRTHQKLFPYNELIRFDPLSRPETWKTWRRGNYVAACSGVLCLQFAVNHGATEIHMVGMEGYAPGDVSNYFTGAKCAPRSVRLCSQVYHPLTQRIINKCVDINFYTYGYLVNVLQGKNVTYMAGVPLVS